MLNLWKLTGEIRTGAKFSDNLREMLAPDLAFVKLILVNSLGISLLSLVLPVSVQAIITNLGILNLSQPILMMTLVLFLILVFSGGIQTLQTYAIEVLRRRLFIRYGGEILSRVVTYDEEAFSKVNRTQLSKRYTDVLLSQSSMVVFFVDGIGFAIQYLITMVLLCLYHPYFLAFGLAITVLLWMSWSFFGPRGVAAGTPEADSRYLAMGWVDEVLRARPVFMSRAGAEFAERRFVDLLSDWNLKRDNLFRQQFAQTISLQVVNAVVYATLVGLGYLLVRKGELSVGQLVAAFIVVTMLLSSLPRLQNFYTSVYDYSTNLDKLAEFWGVPPEAHSGTFSQFSGPIAVDLSRASFPDDVFLDLRIQRGERVFAYIKSFAAARTLNRVLEGFVRPAQGEVRFNGVRYSDIDFRSLREHTLVLTQGRFYSASVADNISGVAGRVVSRSEIEDALDAVGLLDRIRQFPQGIETILPPNAHPLSLSESLSLQLARALVQRPGLVIVTPDFDKLSPVRRSRALEVLLDRAREWTVIFLVQQPLDGVFDRYLLLDRTEALEFPGEAQLFAKVGGGL